MILTYSCYCLPSHSRLCWYKEESTNMKAKWSISPEAKWRILCHICISELACDWLKKWLVACLATSHYLNQCWFLLIGPLGMNYIEMWIKKKYHTRKIIWKWCLPNGAHFVSASIWYAAHRAHMKDVNNNLRCWGDLIRWSEVQSHPIFVWSHVWHFCKLKSVIQDWQSYRDPPGCRHNEIDQFSYIYLQKMCRTVKFLHINNHFWYEQNQV